jgi:type IV pilus assembly protein PilB
MLKRSTEHADEDPVSTPAAIRPTLGQGLREQLGEILLRKGRLDRHQLAQAIAESTAAKQRLGEYLVKHGLVYEDEIAQALADQFGLPYTTLDRGMIDRKAAQLIPEQVARRLNALALRLTDESLTVAVADPTNVLATDELKLLVKRELRLVVSEQTSIRNALDHAYGGVDWLQAEPRHGDPVGIDAPTQVSSIDHTDSSETAPAIEIVNSVLRSAIELNASDVHFIPRRDDLLVRVRVDGVMRDLETVSFEYRPAVTARLKVMGKLDIAERRLPQDGRASITFDHQQTDLRVAVLPSTWGEDVVVRIMYLESQTGIRELADLHLDSQADSVLTHALRQPNGTILLCGPTGSGKTASLYAALRMLNDGSRSIITIEDPVEATLANTVQVQVNEKAGLTFARGLRTILRSDPDVILIGEVRDVETAEIAMQAAMTGHLVLSCIHAQSAPAAVTRLRQMGLPHALLSSALSCIIAQRLVRKPCPTCAQGTAHTPEELVENGLPADAEIYRPRGCSTCSYTGYIGRIAVFESLRLSDEIHAASSEGSTLHIAAAARRAGMRTLRENALALCLAGDTTLDEVNRVCGDAGAPIRAHAPDAVELRDRHAA